MCLLISLGLLAFATPPAHGGTYTVAGCDGTGRVDGWVATASPGYGTSYGAGCPGNPGAGGLIARSVGRADRSLAPQGSHGSWTFWAPAGTRVVGLAGDYYIAHTTYPWASGIRNPDNGQWLYCAAICPNIDRQWVPFWLGGLSLRGIALSAVCVTAAGCRRDGTNGAEAHLSRMVVTLADDWAPGVAITGGSLTAAGWRRGVESLSYSAQDNTGIRTVRVLADGQSIGRDDPPCDPWSPTPCPNTARGVNVDTATAFRRDGAHTITVEATDGGYNVASASRRVYVDNTAPAQPATLALQGGGAWRSTNRFGASWKLPANQGSPISGVTYELCPSSKTERCTMGRRTGAAPTSISDLALPHDGAWTLRLWLRDQAGNEDPNRSVTGGPLRLDRTPPSVALLDRNVDDPARLTVRASDTVSGVASVAIEIHRQGTDVWTQLPVAKTAAGYTATADDEVLPAGTYDIRARAIDLAGNERSASVASAGTPATMILPARLKSTLRAGRLITRGHRTRIASTVRTRFGHSTLLRGRLTAPGGNPIAGTDIEVWQRIALAGTQFERLGSMRTGREGRFKFRIAAGANRVVRFRYPGTPLRRGATRDVRVGVPAASTIRVSPRTAVNGEYATFRGRLRGRPIPTGGKLVELQVFTRRRWRTFAQPRAAASSGRWRYDYRFEAVRGRATFKFRARIRREANYPFELGTSRRVRVHMVGL